MEKELPASGNRIMGRDISGGKTVELRDIDPKMGTVVVEGILFKISERLIKSNGRKSGYGIFTANRMFARKRKNSNATDVSRRNGRVRSVVIIAEKHVKNVN